MLRLGISELPAIETALMHMILSNASARLQGWIVVNTPPYDILIVGSQARILTSPYAKSIAKTFVKIVDSYQESGSGSIVRPIRQENVESWLMTWAGSVMFAATESPVFWGAQTDVRERVKLLKWPPQELLLGDSIRFKIAVLLCRKSMSASELAAVTHQSLVVCSQFVKVLKSFNLIYPVIEDKTPIIQNATTPKRQKVSMSLVQRIRARLGL
jgi:hypothetical protein